MYVLLGTQNMTLFGSGATAGVISSGEVRVDQGGPWVQRETWGEELLVMEAKAGVMPHKAGLQGLLAATECTETLGTTPDRAQPCRQLGFTLPASRAGSSCRSELRGWWNYYSSRRKLNNRKREWPLKRREPQCDSQLTLRNKWWRRQ